MGVRQEVLSKLREQQGFVSGQQICEELGISRTAVWKAVGRLREEGYVIESVPNRGYRLAGSAGEGLLNEAELAHYLAETRWAGHPALYRGETGSTNEDVMRLADEGSPAGTLVVADRQTRGRGRRGRSWVSPDGSNVYMSLLLRPSMAAGLVPMVTLVTALAVCETAQALSGGAGGCLYGIKWPNDIVVRSDAEPDWKKVCGILTELRLEEREIRDVTIGVGLNVNMTEFPEEIRDTATSMRNAAGGAGIDRALLVGRIWERFEEVYELFEKAGSLAPLKERYEAVLVNRGRRVRVLDPKAPFDGMAVGISDTGELAVQLSSGAFSALSSGAASGGENPQIPQCAQGAGAPSAEPEIVYVSAGEVSVRGVEGYV